MPEGGLDGVILRRAEATDSPQCASIFLEGRRDAFPWCPRELFHWHDYYECVKGDQVWIAEAEGRVIGFVSASLAERMICNLFILAGWRSRGIGSRLLACALVELGGVVRLRCASRNLRARQFYRRNGWVEAAGGPAGEGDFVTCCLTRADDGAPWWMG